jgi:HSP20 family protein
MNSFFSRVQPQVAPFPAFNLWAGEESAVVTGEMPGVSLDDLEISVTGNALNVRGYVPVQNQGEGSTYHRQERGSGRFNRVLQLPFPVEAGQVDATLKNGVLTITLPRAYADRPRKIQVKTM